MNVKVTVSTSGKALNIGKSNSIVLKDVRSLDEIHDAINKEFRVFFPPMATLDEPVGKSPKGKK